MDVGQRTLLQGLPSVLGVLGGIVLYTTKAVDPAWLLPAAAYGGALLLLGGAWCLVTRHPRVAILLAETWVVSAVCITALATQVMLWVAASAGVLTGVPADGQEAVKGALVGAIAAYFAGAWLKEIQESKGPLLPSGQCRSLLCRFGTHHNITGDTVHQEACFEHEVRQVGDRARIAGWGIRSRWGRGYWCADYLKSGLAPANADPSDKTVWNTEGDPMLYLTIGRIDDFDKSRNAQELTNAWHNQVRARIDHYRRLQPRFLDPLEADAAAVREQIPWNGFPRVFDALVDVDGSGAPLERARRLDRANRSAEILNRFVLVYSRDDGQLYRVPPDRSRGWLIFPELRSRPSLGDGFAFVERPQDEYLEWFVVRDPQSGRVLRIDYTVEPPEYWETLAEGDPGLAAELYSQMLGQRVPKEDLFFSTDLWCAEVRRTDLGAETVGYERLDKVGSGDYHGRAVQPAEQMEHGGGGRPPHAAEQHVVCRDRPRSQGHAAIRGETRLERGR